MGFQRPQRASSLSSLLDFTLERAGTCQAANDTDGACGSPYVKLVHAWAAYFYELFYGET